jgi:type II secretory pathway pseudopilin PulG
MDKELKGFTLVEVLVYTVVLAIISTSITSIVFQIYRLQSFITDRATLAENIKNTHKLIRDDLYLADLLFVDTNGDLVITSSFSTPATVRYNLDDSTIFRTPDGGTAVAVTDSRTDVYQFAVTDLTTSSASDVVRIQFGMRNFESGMIKPAVDLNLSTTLSVKFVL